MWNPSEPLKVEEVQVDPPNSTQVRVKMLYASMCHTDITYWNGHNYAVRNSFFCNDTNYYFMSYHVRVCVRVEASVPQDPWTRRGGVRSHPYSFQDKIQNIDEHN